MLNIYTDHNIKRDKRFLFDSNIVMTRIRLQDNKYTRDVLKNIDKATYLSETYFLDRNGAKVSSNDLSTTSKILLGLPESQGFILNGVEMGNNCGKLLLQNTSGDIWIPVSRLVSFCYNPNDRPIDVSVDGKSFSTYYEYYEYLEEVC